MPPFTTPPVHSFKLSSGVPVLLLEEHTSGSLRVEVLLRARPAPLGANAMAARGLSLGTKEMNRTQLETANDAEMTQMTSSYAWGWIRVAMTSASDHAASLIARLSAVVLTAAFPADQVVLTTRDAASETEASEGEPRSIAGRVVPMALYGWTRPEDELQQLRSTDLGALRRDDIARAYEAALDPSSACVTVAGDVTENAIRPLLEKAFGAWRARGKHLLPKVSPPTIATSSPRIVVVDRPGTDSLVTFAGEGPIYSSADWTPALVLQRLFNGHEGRATLELRDSDTPLASSSFDLWASPTAPRLTFRVEVPSGRTGELLTRVDRLMRAMKTADVTPEELEDARRPLAAKDGTWTSTIASESSALAAVAVQGLAPDALAKRPARFATVTPDDVRRVAARYLEPDRMKVVIVGDWAKLHDPLVGLGWGAVEVRDTSGVVKHGAP
jgi:predicted Zn-dependent peptidase